MNNHEGGLPPQPKEVNEMTFMYEGKQVSEKEMATVIYNQMTDDKYEKILNKEYPLVTLGEKEYGVGVLLRKADYEYFKELKKKECGFIVSVMLGYPPLGMTYGITWSETKEDE